MANFSLLAKLGLDSKAFQKGLEGAKSRVGEFRKKLNGLRGALAGIGFAAAASRAADYITQMENSAKLAGMASEEFQKFAFATKTVGIEQEKAADILKDVSDKVGDFLATGAGPMADFFEKIAPKVGVTAEQFRNLSGRQALQLYVSSLEKANVSQNEMTFFLEAIASDASALLPLLKNNSKALEDLANKAERVGAVIDDNTAASVKNMNDSFKQAGQVGMAIAAKAFNAGQKAFELYFATLESVRTGNNIIAEMVKSTDKAATSVDNLNRAQKTQIDRQMEVNRLVYEAIGQTNMLLPTIDELARLERIVAKEQEKRAAFQQELIDKERERFIKGKELEALQLRAAGENAAADALEKQIELMKEAIRISNEYGISLKEAAELVKGIDAQDKKGKPGDNGKFEEEEKLIKAKELEALELKAAGKDAQAKALEEQIELMEETIRLAREYNLTREQALNLARGIASAEEKTEERREDTRGDMARSLRGHDLRKAANVAGKEQGIRFERMGDGTFQQFVNGRKGEKFTEAQLQQGLEKQIEKDPSLQTLENIEKILQGRLVNE